MIIIFSIVMVLGAVLSFTKKRRKAPAFRACCNPDHLFWGRNGTCLSTRHCCSICSLQAWGVSNSTERPDAS